MTLQESEQGRGPFTKRACMQPMVIQTGVFRELATALRAS